ncbi:hypothetical protein CIRG_09538 [Coccidioides immitis RMSCC 2394]|uniref:Uncharacterized protein n=1 Tax=Coccidioides immitis RMSCC 2394 TaxID=404692 RepID=A0A0J6YQY0_COCIT|nr:hypothetical protein CIRG_09538 [Coccidioides immitis RMSCC 2394]
MRLVPRLAVLSALDAVPAFDVRDARLLTAVARGLSIRNRGLFIRISAQHGLEQHFILRLAGQGRLKSFPPWISVQQTLNTQPSDQLPADSLNGPDPQIRPAVTPVRYRRKICQHSLLPLRSESQMESRSIA